MLASVAEWEREVIAARTTPALMTDEPLRRRLPAAGREVAARHTWEATARRHLEIYDEIAAESTSFTPLDRGLIVGRERDRLRSPADEEVHPPKDKEPP